MLFYDGRLWDTIFSLKKKKEKKRKKEKRNGHEK